MQNFVAASFLWIFDRGQFGSMLGIIGIGCAVGGLSFLYKRYLLLHDEQQDAEVSSQRVHVLFREGVIMFCIAFCCLLISSYTVWFSAGFGE